MAKGRFLTETSTTNSILGMLRMGKKIQKFQKFSVKSL